MNIITDWFRRNFAEKQTIILAVVLLAGLAVVVYFGNMLMPVLASVVIAYLLEGLVGAFERRGVPRLLMVLLVMVLFTAFLAFLMLVLVPMLWVQFTELLRQLPRYVAEGQQSLLDLHADYAFLSEAQIREFINGIRNEITGVGQQVLSISFSSILIGITLLVYLVLVPVLVFFFLKDKATIVRWFTSLLPSDRRLLDHVWQEVDHQIGNYIRGKFWEILIVGGVSWAVFAFLGLEYAMLMGAAVGISVLVPYIGAAVATVPVALVGYIQWGWGADFAWLIVTYLVIQALDGNVLVPLLFSEVVDLHPVAIIVAVLFFGGIWGFWGVFFAIPLATLVNAVMRAWPTAQRVHAEELEADAEGSSGSGTESAVEE
ncbi:MAG: AI-2E family transporter [Pseudomonadota bacterium]